MNNALQAYNVMASPTPDDTPQWSINLVPQLFNHVAQAKQAQHGSLVDRGANGGLAHSDVRILYMSSRKCTVTGIDQHQNNGLDIVQCAALVNTNHGYVNLIMNEYAYYGKGHTIHSSGQIEWHKNLVDDKSVKVGGTQYINKILTPKNTNSVGWRVETNLSLLWMLSWEISTKQQQKMLLKRLTILNNQPKIG